MVQSAGEIRIPAAFTLGVLHGYVRNDGASHGPVLSSDSDLLLLDIRFFTNLKHESMVDYINRDFFVITKLI